MKHNLYLVRHATTRSGQFYNHDRERELKPEGVEDAIKLGNYIQTSGLSVSLIFSSHAERAKATSLLIAKAINYPVEKILHSEKIYPGALVDMLALVQQTPDSVENILMVGHYPSIVDLHDYLSDYKKSAMATSEMSAINFNAAWADLSEGCGKFVFDYHPLYKPNG